MSVHNNYIFKEHNFVFMGIPKSGNSSVKSLLTNFIDPELIHGENKRAHIYSHFDDISNADLFAKKNNFFISTIVRNPWDRFVSCYSDKICGKVLYKPFERYGCYHNMPFEEFIETIFKIDDARMNIHARSQFELLSYKGCLLPQYIGRLDTIEEDWENIRLVIKRKSGVELPEIPHINRSKRKNYTEYYTRKTRLLVRDRYQKDISLFGFEYGK